MVNAMTARAVSPIGARTGKIRGRVLILTNAKDAPLVRAAVETAGAEVVAVSADPIKAIQTVQEMRPDLVLASIFFDGEPTGIELTREIQEKLGISVVYLGRVDDPLLLLQVSMTQPAGLISDLSDAKYLQAVVGRALKGVRPTIGGAPY